MKKPAIFYYSDCPFFAGCENMIANLLNSPKLLSLYDFTIIYNDNSLYEEGLLKRTDNTIYRRIPVKLCRQSIVHKTQYKGKITLFSYLIKLIIFLPNLIYKYISVFINIIILFRLFSKKQIDLLHINNGGYPAAYSCYSAVIAAKLSGVKRIVYVVNNIADGYKSPSRWIDYILDRFVKKNVNIFITGSDYAGHVIKTVLHLKENKHRTINNGTTPKIIQKSKNEFLKHYNIFSESKLIFSVIGLLEVRKGHIYLLEAIKKLADEIEFELPYFLIAGDGSEFSNLNYYIEKNDLTRNVLLIGYVENVFDLINASDVIILPSIMQEDFPNVIIEAMSMGKPVIGTKVADIPEQVENFKTGIIVPPKDSAALAEAIKYLCSNRGLLKNFSIEAKNKYISMYRTELIVDKYLSLYQSLLT